MSDLRLRLSPLESSEPAPPVYRFPVEEVRGEGDADAAAPETRPMDALELANQIDQALDVLQERLDNIHEELDDLDDALRFPDPDDWRPSAA